MKSSKPNPCAMLWEAAAVSLLHKYNSSMEGSALVNIVWRGQKQRILLYPGISSSEVQGVLDAVFHSGDAGGGPVLGLKDAGTGIAYPLSYITAHPSQFGGGSFELVMAVASHEKPPSFLAAARKSHNDLDICSNQISNRPFEPSTSNLSGEESGSPEDDMTAALERIALVKRTLSLEVIDSIQLKYLFLQSRDEDTARELSLASFVRCMGRLGAESSSRNALIPLIFDVFVGSSGKASIDALTNGLSIFCRGSIEEKIVHTFTLIDTVQNGFIRQDDLAGYFEAVYAVVFQIVPDFAMWINCPSAEAAGEMTAAHAFQFCADGAAPSDRLGFEDFATWYRATIGNYGIEEFPIPMVEQSQMSFGVSGGSEVLDTLDNLDVFQVQQALGLVNVPASNLAAYFKQFVDQSGNIPKEDFIRAFHELMDYMRPTHSTDSQMRGLVDGIIRRIAALYSIPNSFDLIDLRGFTSGIILFCGGDAESKAEAVFDVYKLSTRISRNIIVAHLLSSFAMMNEFDPAFPSQEVSVNIAKNLVDESFSRLGLRGPDRCMTRSQFTAWLAAGEQGVHGGPGFLSGPVRGTWSSHDSEAASSDYDGEKEGAVGCEDASESGVSASSSDVSLSALFTASTKSRVKLEMRAARYLIGLQFFTADDLLDMVGEFSKEGVISSFSWFKVVSSMLTLCGRGEVESRRDTDPTLFLAQRIFNALDIHSVEAVNYTDLVLALANLCNSPVEDRVMVVFTLLDESGAGIIPYEALLRHFVAFYRVISVMSPSISDLIEALGVAIETLARCALDGALSALKFDTHADLLLTLGEVSEIVEYIVDRAE